MALGISTYQKHFLTTFDLLVSFVFLELLKKTNLHFFCCCVHVMGTVARLSGGQHYSVIPLFDFGIRFATRQQIGLNWNHNDCALCIRS